MNNRQTYALKETYRSEQRARERWENSNPELLSRSVGGGQGKGRGRMVQGSIVAPGPFFIPYADTEAEAEADIAHMAGTADPLAEGPGARGLGGVTANANADLPALPQTPENPSMPSDNSIYGRAVRVSSPRLVDDFPADKLRVTRKLIRQVEIPYKRNVRVPLQDGSGYRIDTVEDTRLVEVEEDQEYELCPVPKGAGRVVKVTAVDASAASRDGSLPSSRLSRTIGSHRYSSDDPRLARYPVDVDNTENVPTHHNYGANPFPSSSSSSSSSSSAMKKKKKGARKAAGRGGQGRQNFSTSGASIVSAASSSGRRTRTRTTNSTSDGTSNGRSALANTSSSSGAAAAGGAGYAAYAHMTARGQTKTPLGLKLQDCGERGVRVYKVVAGSLADTGGLRTSDLLVRVNNRPTRSLAEFRKVVSSSIQSTLLVKVERRGVGAIECRLKR